MAGFSFPPPPPPPPKAAPQESSATNHAQPGAFMYGPDLGRGGGGRGGGSRGGGGRDGGGRGGGGRGGGDRERGRGRGRGSNNRGGFGRGGTSNAHASPHQTPHFNRALPQQQQQNTVANVSSFNMSALPVGGYINPAFASMYTNGLNSAPSAPQPWLAHTQSSQNPGQNLPRPTSSHRPQTKPKVQAAPSVPSFGFALDVVKPQVPSTSNSHGSTSKKRKHNGLGLTPRSDIREDSEEDDADEEAKYSAAGGVLQFEYKGRSSTLKPEDVAAWIQERKKRFPTKDRVAQKKKEEEEAKEARRLAREQAEAEHKSKHPQQERQTKKRKPNKDASEQDKAIQKTKKLREKLRRAEERITKVKAKRESIPKKPKVEDAPKNNLGINYDSEDSAGLGSDDGSNSLADSSSEVSTDSDSDDSSSSNDESDDDAPPEKESIEKRPMKVFLPNRKAPPATAQQTRREREKNPPKRVTLRDRMVEQERRQEAELALQAIKILGENGMLG